jgi:hypothetical protein
VAEYVLLDADPLGIACRQSTHPSVAPLYQWLRALDARGPKFVVPEITDYEVRRELMRIGASASLRRLDALVTAFGLLCAPITTNQMRLAAAFWADARRRGFPTAAPDALDGDVILAACASTIGHPGDHVMVATANVGHLARYCDSRLWMTIT